jgi:hypothetical protein
MSYSLPPNFFSKSFLFSKYIRHNYLTRASKLFEPVRLPNPNYNQRLTPFHSLSSSWQRSTYVANHPHPIALTHSLDRTSDSCNVLVHHFLFPLIHKFIPLISLCNCSPFSLLCSIFLMYSMTNSSFSISSIAKRPLPLPSFTIFCLYYFYFFPCALLYSFVFAIQSAIAIIITIHLGFLVCFAILFHY